MPATRTTKSASRKKGKRGRKRLPPIPVIRLTLSRDLYRALVAVTAYRRAKVENEIIRRVAKSFAPSPPDTPQTMRELIAHLDKLFRDYANRPLGNASMNARTADMQMVAHMVTKMVEDACSTSEQVAIAVPAFFDADEDIRPA